MQFDFLIVGAGIFGATFARRVSEAGYSSLVIDRREHIAGNCFTTRMQGIDVHQYGPHIFHTASERVWTFVNQFAAFNSYVHRGCVNYRGRLYSFPINLLTLKQVYETESSEEAIAKLAKARVHIERPRSMREWWLSQVGEELYEIFFRGYTWKQWGKDPADLPASIARRMPVRTSECDRYYGASDVYQGIPIQGYTHLVEQLLDSEAIRVELGIDFLEQRDAWRQRARCVVFSGPIDAYFEYARGRLAYRSLRLDHERREGIYQSSAVVNYTEAVIPFTRVTEHKHFTSIQCQNTVVTREYVQPYDDKNEPFYPIRDVANLQVFKKYQQLAKHESAIFGGRLGTYQYYDMDQVIAQALSMADATIGAQSPGWINSRLSGYQDPAQ